MDDWLPIDENAEINVEDIMHKIRAYIAERRLQGEPVDGLVTPSRFKGRFNSTLYDELFAAIREKDGVAVSLHVTPSSIPVVGGLVETLRRKAHELVVYYLNQGAMRQVTFNNHTVRAFSALVEELENDLPTQAEVAELKQEIESLKTRLDSVEGI